MRRTLFFASLLLVASSAFANHFVYNPGRVLTDADRADLASRGIVVQRPLTNGRYVVSVEPTKNRERIGVDAVEGLEPLTPERKMLRSAVHELAKAYATSHLRVMFHEDVTFDEARTAILAAGAALDDPLAFELGVMQQIDVVVPRAAVDRLMSDDRVFVVSAAPLKKIASDNAVSAALSHVTELQTAPYDLSGKGIVASLFELAEGQASHPEFQGRITVNTTGGATDDKAHATHVMGTIAAAGLEPQAKGMAPAVTLQQYRASGTVDNWLKAKDTTLPAIGSVADNNSWGYVLAWDPQGSDWVWNDGEVYFGAYDLVYTAPIDQIARRRGILFVHSAGNDADVPSLGQSGQHRHVDANGDTITNKTFCYSKSGSGTDCPTPTCSTGSYAYPDGTTIPFCETVHHPASAPYDTMSLTASGKNTVAVGAVDDLKNIASFSSRGPAKDGRVKPDVVARGMNVLSTVPTNTYTRKNGTSMSSPVVTGVAVLLTEQWKRTFGTNPTVGQLKALLIAGAEDLGNPGPDYTYGFGLVNAQASVDLIRTDAGAGTRIKNGSLAQDARYETAVSVPAGQKFRATLQWVDPEIVFIGGEDEIAAKALVNDLDLTVTTPNGDIVKPYVLNPLARTAPATRGTNTIDNTEVVEIANPTAGVYHVAVAATRISDQSPQAFTLITNAAAAPPCIDTQEANNSSDTAYGNLTPTQNVAAALCSNGDVDFFKFAVTKGGPVTVTVNATGDVAIRATLTRDGAAVGSPIDVPAGESRTLSFNVAGGVLAQPVNVVLRLEAVPNASGIMPTYSFTPNFGQVVPARSRSIRKR